MWLCKWVKAPANLLVVCQLVGSSKYQLRSFWSWANRTTLYRDHHNGQKLLFSSLYRDNQLGLKLLLLSLNSAHHNSLKLLLPSLDGDLQHDLMYIPIVYWYNFFPSGCQDQQSAAAPEDPPDLPNSVYPGRCSADALRVRGEHAVDVEQVPSWLTPVNVWLATREPWCNG